MNITLEQVDIEKVNLETWLKDKSNRILVKKRLPKHFAKTIAKSQGCSHNTVYQLMAGNYFNLKLFLALLELAAQNETVEKDLQEKAIDILKNSFNQIITTPASKQEVTQETQQESTQELIADLTNKGKHEQNIEHSKRICTGSLFEP